MSYAILRIAKLTSNGNISASIDHNLRERECDNADPSLSHLNEYYNTASLENIKTLTDEYMTRKDNVKVFEVLLTASPEFFASADEKQISDWKKENLKFLENKFGKDNCKNIAIHADERTLHIHAHIIPLVTQEVINRRTDAQIKANEKGTTTTKKMLSAKYFIGGRDKLRNLQTQYAKSMEGFGLTRGEEKSVAKHQSIKEYYAKNVLKDDINKDLQALTKKQNQINKEIIANTERISEQVSTFNKNKVIVDKQVQDFNNVKVEKEQVNKDLQALKKEKVQIQKEIKSVQNSKIELLEDVQAITAQKSDLNKDVQALQEQQAQLQQHLHEINTQESKLKLAQNKLAELQKKQETTQCDIDKLTKAIVEKPAANAHSKDVYNYACALVDSGYPTLVIQNALKHSPDVKKLPLKEQTAIIKQVLSSTPPTTIKAGGMKGLGGSGGNTRAQQEYSRPVSEKAQLLVDMQEIGEICGVKKDNLDKIT